MKKWRENIFFTTKFLKNIVLETPSKIFQKIAIFKTKRDIFTIFLEVFEKSIKIV